LVTFTRVNRLGLLVRPISLAVPKFPT